MKELNVERMKGRCGTNEDLWRLKEGWKEGRKKADMYERGGEEERSVKARRES